ncbi:lytic murein transglycosylase [Solwaraspora sp. WMMD791]|uniref:lytic transglycosylase domain-containing protein n=1 Tax=Solwaraspora sp. WMMD791 TaxID=3016086 RepID=UPI00249B45ED|nr:lytic murein transglycosylase [Solwaraspora sp. WMMD791]WFE26508.1 lytic murein transglycosylase [Solwaraspora sp. WMMD791]
MVEDGAGTPTARLRPAVPAPAQPPESTSAAPTPTPPAERTAERTEPTASATSQTPTPDRPAVDPPSPDRPEQSPPEQPPPAGPQSSAAAAPQQRPPAEARPTQPEARPDQPEAGPDQPGPVPAPVDLAATGTQPTGRHRRDDPPFTRRVGRLHPARLRPIARPVARSGRRAARAVGAWCRRPSGRLALPGLLLLALIAGSGTAGAVLVPAAAGMREPVNTPGPVETTAVPEVPALTDPDLLDPTAPPLDDQGEPAPPLGPTRPAAVLTGWATQTASRLAIPVVALEAYGYAELVLATTTPGCRLSWTTLAAIGMIESTHGTANGSRLDTDGRAVPPIVGLPLDGAGGRQRIADTDDGRLDNDVVYDRAVGPMQFIPTTWAEFGVDADNDGVVDPQDIDDASLAAANYLCRNGRDLSTPSDWWSAILSYNNVQPYAQSVFDTANEYGVRSRT